MRQFPLFSSLKIVVVSAFFCHEYPAIFTPKRALVAGEK
jgi:hypothetical protein